jgi:hypothetical protein
MSANPNVPVLFYSERCPNSKEVVQTIQALNKAALFRFVCIDTTPRQYIPVELKSVPTVIIPQTKEMVVGKAAIFARVSKPVDSRREVPQARAAGPQVPEEWSFNEVNGISSSYSMFDDKAAQPNNQYRYSLIDGIQTSGQDTISPDGTVRGDSNTESRLGSLQSTRDAEFKATSRS